MNATIDLTEPARDRALLADPVVVTRPKTTKVGAGEDAPAIDPSHESSATRSSNNTKMLALQLAGTFMMVIACTATFAITAWLLFDMAGSAANQLFMLSPDQMLQGMVGR